MKNWLNISKYRVLKTFIKGETIKCEVDNIPHTFKFVRVSCSYLTVLNSDNFEECIELEHITKITL